MKQSATLFMSGHMKILSLTSTSRSVPSLPGGPPFSLYLKEHFLFPRRVLFFLLDTDINKFCGYPFLVSQWHFDKQNFLTWLFNVLISDLSDIYFCVPLKKSLFPSKLWWSHLLLFSGSLIILPFTFRSTISLG